MCLSFARHPVLGWCNHMGSPGKSGTDPFAQARFSFSSRVAVPEVQGLRGSRVPRERGVVPVRGIQALAFFFFRPAEPRDRAA